MTATTRRRRGAAAFEVEQLTQHWRVINGRIYRDAVVVLADGSRRLYSLPEMAA
jgi:hypothetical protein